MASKSISSYHCEVCKKDTRHIKSPLNDVMREMAGSGAVARMVFRVRSLLGRLASRANHEAYKCTRCRSYLIPHLGKNHCYVIDHDFQPWYVVQRSPKMLRYVRETYNPNL